MTEFLLRSNRLKNCKCCKSLSGYIISTSSSEFPHIVFSSRNKPLALFPQSLYFVENRIDLSKAQKSKFSCCLTTGDPIDYIIDQNNIVVDYTRIVQQDRKIRYGEKILLEDYVIVSPEIPRRCWSTWLSGFVSAPLELLSDAVPNIVYEAYLAIDAYLTDSDQLSQLPIPHITIELGTLEKPVPNNSREDDIYHAQWNLPDTRGLFQDFLNLFDCSDIIQENYRKLPKPPRNIVTSALLYVLENRQLIWPSNPLHKVVMGVLPSKEEKKMLVEGCNIRADMFYCKFNSFYVVYRYYVMSKDTNFPWLNTRQKIDVAEFGGHTEYFLELTFSNYNGFFVNKQLKNCLIDDPKHLLLKQTMIARNLIFHAWVRLNDLDKAAQFSVASLTDNLLITDLNYFLKHEIPDISGTGFVVNICTGSVFCDFYPKLRIILMIPDRLLVDIGEFINFKATYFSLMNAFIIFEFESAKRFSRRFISNYRGFLFEERLNCTKVKSCYNLYEGKEVGLVTDLEEIIRMKAVVENIEMPNDVLVYLEENLDINRSTFFNVYALHFNLNLKDLEVEDQVQNCPPTNNWWKSQNPSKCKCREIKEICKKLLEFSECIEFFEEEINNLFSKLRQLC